MAKFNTGQSFADGDTVTGAKLNNITSQLNIYTGVISEQTAMSATVSTADQLLIADVDNGDSGAANRITVQKLFSDSLTNGTFASVNLTGTITSNRTVATSATITTGTIPTLVSNNATIGTTTGTAGVFTSGTITTGLIPTLTVGTTTSTAANITNGTVQTLTASTATITSGTYSGLINSSTGTFSGAINSTLGTIATLNSTTGTITGLRSTTGTVATLNSTTGTITNLSTTLAGDFTISQGTGTIGTATITPAKLSQPITSGIQVASTSGTAIDFTGIPSWIKKVTVMLNGVSTSGASLLQIQIGSGSIQTSGYSGYYYLNNTLKGSFSSAFIIAAQSSAASINYGSATLNLIGSNTWVETGIVADSGFSLATTQSGGVTALSGSLDRIRLTTVNGTDTFDAGVVNIIYEG